MKLLKKLFEIYSPSGKEGYMKKYLRRYIKKNIKGCKVWYDKKGNMYVKKGRSESYPCVVAHLDQVQKIHPKDFKVCETDEIIFGYSSYRKMLCGLGGDDKCGVWIAIKCLEKYENIKIAFFVEEETGCCGSEKADMEFFDDVRFVIEPDRKGSGDLITSISWTDLCSREFLDATDYKDFGYHEEQGMMTDILTLKEKGLGVSCINLSCGYYNPHTDEEFVVKKDLENALSLVEHIIEKVTEPSEHTPENGFDFYDDFYREDELFDIIDNTLSYEPETTAEEMREYYRDYFPGLTIEDYERAIEEWKSYNEPFKE